MRVVNFNVDYLKSCLSYNENTGVFIWKFREDKPNNWNGRFFGKVAGGLSTGGYIILSVNATSYYAHRLAWEFINGEIPPRMCIDHIDRDRTNNSINNLRLASYLDNSANSRGLVRTSKHKGVHKDKTGYTAQITRDGKTTTLVGGVEEYVAASYYNYAANILFKNFSVINETPYILSEVEKEVIKIKL